MKKNTSPSERYGVVKSTNIIKFGQTQAPNIINKSSNFIKLGANIISSNGLGQSSFSDNTPIFKRYNYLNGGSLKGRALILNNHNLMNNQEHKKLYSLGASTMRNLQQASISINKSIVKHNEISSIKNTKKERGLHLQIRTANIITQERSVKIEDIKDNRSGRDGNKTEWNSPNSQLKGFL